MADEDDIAAAPVRPKRTAPPEEYTHDAYAFRRVGRKWGVYRGVGVGRAPPCPHCGQPYTAPIKIFVDRLIAFGGSTGGFLLTAPGVQPPRLEREYAGQAEFDEKEILPET